MSGLDSGEVAIRFAERSRPRRAQADVVSLVWQQARFDPQRDDLQVLGEISDSTSPADASLFRGLALAMDGNWPAGAEALFQWLTCETSFCCVNRASDKTRPGVEIGLESPGVQTPVERARVLTEVLRDFALLKYEDDSELYEDDSEFVATLAVALSKFHGSRAEFAAALDILDAALAAFPASFPIDNARYVVRFCLIGEEPLPHWRRFIGPDSGYLSGLICRSPFEMMDLTETGATLVCCGHWLPDKSIGNVLETNVAEVFNSEVAQRIRQSVTDGSYRYCNHVTCVQMRKPIGGSLLVRKATTCDPALRKAIDEGYLIVDAPKHVLFGLDNSCNLSCPSCRDEVLLIKGEARDRIAEKTQTEVVPLLRQAKLLLINPSGELFFSKASRSLLAMLSRQDFPELDVDIISNGVLFTPKNWNSFPGLHEMTRRVRISVDGATRTTFETLRRGGNFDVLVANLEFIGELRKRGAIRQFVLSFTYQAANFREMPEFVEFGDRFGCDAIMFERLQNLVFSPEEYAEKAVHVPESRHYEEFREICRHPNLRRDAVQRYSDFDFGTAA